MVFPASARQIKLVLYHCWQLFPFPVQVENVDVVKQRQCRIVSSVALTTNIKAEGSGGKEVWRQFVANQGSKIQFKTKGGHVQRVLCAWNCKMPSLSPGRGTRARESGKWVEERLRACLRVASIFQLIDVDYFLILSELKFILDLDPVVENIFDIPSSALSWLDSHTRLHGIMKDAIFNCHILHTSRYLGTDSHTGFTVFCLQIPNQYVAARDVVIKSKAPEGGRRAESRSHVQVAQN